MAYTKKKRQSMKHRNIGLDAKPPEKTCNDVKCPWHGSLPLRGRVHTAVVKSTKANRTAIVRWDYMHYMPKFERYERRNSRKAVHNPACIDAQVDDVVKMAECRPLSKTKKFVIIEKVSA